MAAPCFIEVVLHFFFWRELGEGFVNKHSIKLILSLKLILLLAHKSSRGLQPFDIEAQAHLSEFHMCEHAVYFQMKKNWKKNSGIQIYDFVLGHIAILQRVW